MSDAVIVLDLENFGKPLALGVRVIPEVEEQGEKEQAIKGNNVYEDGELIGAILHEEVLTNVNGDDDKLRLCTQGKKKIRF